MQKVYAIKETTRGGHLMAHCLNRKGVLSARLSCGPGPYDFGSAANVALVMTQLKARGEHKGMKPTVYDSVGGMFWPEGEYTVAAHRAAIASKIHDAEKNLAVTDPKRWATPDHPQWWGARLAKLQAEFAAVG